MIFAIENKVLNVTTGPITDDEFPFTSNDRNSFIFHMHEKLIFRLCLVECFQDLLKSVKGKGY
jgi:hypothetical protein